jgi:hypothetical protein
MPRGLSCPLCRVALPAGGTHCPRCGLRIAPLERRRKPQDVQAALAAAADAGTPVAAPRHSLRTAMLLGAMGGVLLVGLAALIAFAVTRGHAYAVALSNAAFFTGGITMTLAVVLGGVRVSRLLGDVELMKQKARGEQQRAPGHVRAGFATAAALPLALAVVLAATAR